MKLTQEIAEGLLLLARSHPKGRITVEDDRLTFDILVEDLGVMSKKDEELLENQGWALVEYKEIVLWVYYVLEPIKL